MNLLDHRTSSLKCSQTITRQLRLIQFCAYLDSDCFPVSSDFLNKIFFVFCLLPEKSVESASNEQLPIESILRSILFFKCYLFLNFALLSMIVQFIQERVGKNVLHARDESRLFSSLFLLLRSDCGFMRVFSFRGLLCTKHTESDFH